MLRADRLCVILIAAICAAGCAASNADPASHPRAMTAPYPPPPKRAEIPPPPPAPDLLWLVGHWRWDGANYAWTPGHYAQRPTPAANWLPGYWLRDDSGWQWTAGHWDG